MHTLPLTYPNGPVALMHRGLVGGRASQLARVVIHQTQMRRYGRQRHQLGRECVQYRLERLG